MPDQATELRRLVREAVDVRADLAPGAPVIVLSAAQPRLGATTAVCGLARQLLELGKRVILIDANFPAPALAERYRIRPHGTLANVLAGSRRAVEVLATPLENLRVLPGAAQTASGAGAPQGPATPAVPQLDGQSIRRLQGELAALARQADVVLVDAGAGMTPWVDQLWQLAHRVLLITTPAPAAVVDAYAAVKHSHHERLAGKLQLVVTRCDAPADAARIHAGFSETCVRFLGQAVAPPAILPAFPHVAAGGAPAHPQAADPYARSLRLLAADLACDFRALAARLPERRGGYQPKPAAISDELSARRT